ncbi:MAG: hypothetical protein WDZ88_02060 [Candidatus Paceibacterota bacterium]
MAIFSLFIGGSSVYATVSLSDSYSGYSYANCHPDDMYEDQSPIVGSSGHSGSSRVDVTKPISAQVTKSYDDVDSGYAESDGWVRYDRVFEAASTFDTSYALSAYLRKIRVSEAYPEEYFGYCNGNSWLYSAVIEAGGRVATIGSVAWTNGSIAGQGKYAFGGGSGYLADRYGLSSYGISTGNALSAEAFGPNPSAIAWVRDADGNAITDSDVPSGGSDNTEQIALRPISIIRNKNTGERVSGPHPNNGCGVVEYYKEATNTGVRATAIVTSYSLVEQTPYETEYVNTSDTDSWNGDTPAISGRNLCLDSVPSELDGIVSVCNSNWETVAPAPTTSNIDAFNTAKNTYSNSSLYEVVTYSVVEHGSPSSFYTEPESEYDVYNEMFNFASKAYGRVVESCTEDPVVDPNPLSCTVSPSESRVNTGEEVRWTATVFNGTPASYSWEGSSNLTGSGATVDKTYYNAESQNAVVQVTDSSGRTTSCGGMVNVDPTLEASCYANPNSTNLESGMSDVSVDWVAVPKGGTGTYTYEWSGDVSGGDISETEVYTSTGVKSGSVLITSGSETVSANCSATIAGGLEYNVVAVPDEITIFSDTHGSLENDDAFVKVEKNLISGDSVPVDISVTLTSVDLDEPNPDPSSDPNSDPFADSPYNRANYGFTISFDSYKTCGPTCSTNITLQTGTDGSGGGFPEPTPAGTYRFQVSSNVQTESGIYPYDNFDVVVTGTPPPNTPYLGPTTGASCGAETRVQFSNQTGSETEYNGYRLMRNTENNFSEAVLVAEFEYLEDRPELSWGSGSAALYQEGKYTDTTPNAGTPYYYFLQAYTEDGSGNKTYSNVAYLSSPITSTYECLTGTPSCVANPSIENAGNIVNFEGSNGTVSGGQEPYTYSYRFSDMTTSYISSPNYGRTFSTAGVENAYLSVQSTDGQTSVESASCPVTINSVPPTVSFEVKPKLGDDTEYVYAPDSPRALSMAYNAANGGNNDDNQVTLRWDADAAIECVEVTGSGYEDWDTADVTKGTYTTSGPWTQGEKRFRIQCDPPTGSNQYPVTADAYVQLGDCENCIDSLTCQVRQGNSSSWVTEPPESSDPAELQVRLGEKVQWQVVPSPADDGSYEYSWDGSTPPLNTADTALVEEVEYKTTGVKTAKVTVSSGGDVAQCGNNLNLIVLPPRPDVNEF